MIPIILKTKRVSEFAISYFRTVKSQREVKQKSMISKQFLHF